MRPLTKALLPGLFGLLAVFGWPGSVDRAHAASCQAMRAELASLSKGGNNAASRAQIGRLEQRARANGCRGASTFGRPRVCAGIDAQINSLRAGGGGNARRISRLRRQISRQCGNTREARRTDQPRRAASTSRQTTVGDRIVHGTRDNNRLDDRARRGEGFGGFLANLFGGGAPIEEVRGNRQSGVERIVEDAAQPAAARRQGSGNGGQTGRGVPRGGGLSTWCVRLCDGYYFPIARGTSSRSYGQQYAMCRARCPGADVSLYAHQTDSPTENMRSAISGEPYRALPTAFAYRRTYKSDCSCAPKPAMTQVAAADAPAMVLTDVDAGGGGPSDRVRAILRPVGPVAVVGGRSTLTSASIQEAQGDLPRWMRPVEVTRMPLLPKDELSPAEDADTDAPGSPEDEDTEIVVASGDDPTAADPEASDEAVADAEATDEPVETIEEAATGSEAERAAAYAAAEGTGAYPPGAERLPQGELPVERRRFQLPPPPRDDDLPANAGGPSMAAGAPTTTAPPQPLRTRTVGPTFFAVRVAGAALPSPAPQRDPSELP